MFLRRDLRQWADDYAHTMLNTADSLVVMEHDLDVIAKDDWVIDLGPKGGDAGGRTVATAAPERGGSTRTQTDLTLRAVLAR